MRRLPALLLLALAGCGGGPDGEALHAGVKERLAEALPGGTVSLARLERRGSQSDNKAPAGETRRTVYYDAELRIAQAQLVGWLEGLFHGIQAAMFAQQAAARAQFEELRRRGLPGTSDPQAPGADQSRGPYL